MSNNVAVCFFCLWVTNLVSQNLVYNPSFEKTNNCSFIIGEFGRKINNWQSPSFGSTDLFNKCSKDNNGIPYNYQGIQLVKFGDKYAGCYFYSDQNYREYVQGDLIETLVKGEKYLISFYISLSEISDFSIKNIDFILSEKKFTFLIDKHISLNKRKKIKGKFELFEVENERTYANKIKWIKVSKEIIASGYENHITIGNFQSNLRTKKNQSAYKLKNKIAYYYIDMVSVESIDINISGKLTDRVADNKKGTPLKLNKPYVLKKVLFEFDKDVLLESSKKYVLELYNLLEGNNLNLIINGYTDNEGSDSYNEQLSTLRAKSVVDFLISKGISKERLFYKGHGKDKPIADNTLEEGREKNRRVEFVLTKDKQ